MPVKYKLHQDNRKNAMNKGKWFGRVAYGAKDTLSTDALVEAITQETTLTDVEVIGVIRALLRHIRNGLRNGQKVQLEKFGTFKVGMSTSGADTPKKFNVANNVKSLRLIFQPYVITEKVNGKNVRLKSLLSGVTVTEMGKYDIDSDDDQPNP